MPLLLKGISILPWPAPADFWNVPALKKVGEAPEGLYSRTLFWRSMRAPARLFRVLPLLAAMLPSAQVMVPALVRVLLLRTLSVPVRRVRVPAESGCPGWADI
jgi:hypothetical protein